MYFVECCINGFELFGMVENGLKFLIYSDLYFYWNCGEIVFDFNYMLDIFVSVIIIEGLGDIEKILMLCEVFVFGKCYIFLFLNCYFINF